MLVEHQVVRPAQLVLAAPVDDGLDLAALHIDALDRAALIVVGLRPRHDHLAGGDPGEATIVADVHLAVGAEGCAIRAAGNLRDHLFPPVGINPRQPLAPDFDQHHRAVGHDDRAFRKFQIGGENADIGHEILPAFWLQADFQARPRTRNISLRHVMAKRIALANPTTCATGITGAGGGAKSGLMAKALCRLTRTDTRPACLRCATGERPSA